MHRGTWIYYEFTWVYSNYLIVIRCLTSIEYFCEYITRIYSQKITLRNPLKRLYKRIYIVNFIKKRICHFFLKRQNDRYGPGPHLARNQNWKILIRGSAIPPPSEWPIFWKFEKFENPKKDHFLNPLKLIVPTF